MSARHAAKWAGPRIATFGLYVFAIIGITGWDRNPDSWFLIAFRLIAGATFLSWAVQRTVGHWHEDQEDK